MSPADQVLFERWRTHGDPDAFKRLAGKYAAMVYAVGKRLTGNTHDAEDVAQAAFESLASQQRAPGVHLGAWLHRVATYRALSLLRGERRRKEREIRYRAEQPKQTEIGWDDIYDLVDEAIAALPDRQREVLIAYYFEGMTHSDIARELGISRPAVTQRVQKGVNTIRAALKRRDIAVPLTVLSGLLTRGASAEVPSTVAAITSKIALAGYAGKAATGAGLWQAVISGWGWAKGLSAGLTVVVLAVGAMGTWERIGREKADPVEATISDEGAASLVAEAFTVAPTSPSTTETSPTPDLVPPAEEALLSTPGISYPSLSGQVVDERGRPWPGARVYASVTEAGAFNQRRSAEADEDGSFAFGKLPEGTIFVIAQPPGWHISDAASEVEALAYPIRSGQKQTGVRLVLDSRNYGRIEGRVLDRVGQPVAGAAVRANGGGPGAGSLLTAQSGSDGRYTVINLKRGHQYHLIASSPDHTAAGVDDIPTGSTNVDLVLAGTGIVEGQVVDARTGAPLTEYSCMEGRTFGNSGVPWSGPVGGPPIVSSLDEQGHFRLAGVSVGDTSIVVKAVGYREQAVNVSPVEEGKTLRGVVIALEATRGVTGWVVDVDHNPIPGATIRSKGGPGIDPAVATSEADGWFSIPGVDDADTHLVATRDDYTTTHVPLEPADGEPLTIVLSRGGVVEGRITIGGQPDSYASVGVGAKSVQARSDGAYRIEGVSPGVVAVSFSVPAGTGNSHRTRTVDALVEQGKKTTVDMDFIPPTAELEGVVTRGGVAQPRATVKLAIETEEGREDLTTWTDGIGFYRFAQLPHGLASLAVYPNALPAKRMDFALSPGTRTTRDIDLHAGSSLICTFQNIPESVERVWVAVFALESGLPSLNGSQDQASAIVVVDIDQPAALEGIEPGHYTVVGWGLTRDYRAAETREAREELRATLPVATTTVEILGEPELAVELAFHP